MQSAEQMSLFTGFVKGNIAKELGRLHDWRENFWGRRYHCASIQPTENDQIRRFLYIVENGCKEGLVASPLDWPGVSTAGALYRGENTMQGTWYDRSAEYRARLRNECKLFPSAETVHLTPLPFLQERSVEKQRAFYVKTIREIESKTAKRHEEKHSTPGARAIQRQDPSRKTEGVQSLPCSDFPRREIRAFWGDVQRASSKSGRVS